MLVALFCIQNPFRRLALSWPDDIPRGLAFGSALLFYFGQACLMLLLLHLVKLMRNRRPAFRTSVLPKLLLGVAVTASAWSLSSLEYACMFLPTDDHRCGSAPEWDAAYLDM
jgi:hypothetical protein